MRKLIIPALAAVLLTAGAAWWIVPRLRVPAAVRQTAGAMAGGVEAWAGTQVVRILNDYLRPELVVESFQYDPPARLTLNGVKIIDNGVEVINAASIVVELRDVPERGQPVVIESVQLEQPVIRLIPRKAGGLLGFSDMVESATGQAYDDGGSSRPSDVLAIRRIAIDNATVSYEPANRPAMVLDGVALKSDYDPSTSTPGVYGVNTTLSRPPVLSLSVAGDLNLDASWLRIDESTLKIGIDEKEYGVFPPAFQEYLRTIELRGHLTLAMTGMMPFTSATPTDLAFDGTLRDSNVALGSYQLPMQQVTAKFHVGNDRIDVASLEATAFRGTGTVHGSMPRDDAMSADVHLSVSSMHIEDALRTPANETPKFAGQVTGSLDLTGQLANLPASLDGSGDLAIANAMLWNDVVISGLHSELDVAPDETRYADHGSCRLRVLGDMVQLREIECVSDDMGVRGEGEVLYDRTLNFRVNAGPMERAQSEMGPLGDVLGGLTDQLVKYQIMGPWSDPNFEVRPFGIGAEESKSSVQ